MFFLVLRCRKNGIFTLLGKSTLGQSHVFLSK